MKNVHEEENKSFSLTSSLVMVVGVDDEIGLMMYCVDAATAKINTKDLMKNLPKIKFIKMQNIKERSCTKMSLGS
jgi:hypothetical protein